MKVFLVAALLAAVAGVDAQPLSAADVASSYQIDPAHDGQVRFESAFQAPLKQKWVRDLGGTVSYPVYGGGLVFVTVSLPSGPVLFALDSKTGKIAWQTNITGGGPAYDYGRVFVVDFGGLLQAYNAKDGSLAWSEQQQDQYAFFDPPTAFGGSVYLTGAGSGVTLYAARARQGKPLWMQQGPAGDSNPGIGGGNVYVTYPCNDYAYKVSDGARLWSHQTGCDGGGGAPAVYFDNGIYTNDGNGNVVLDAQTGTVVRTWPGGLTVPAFWTPLSGTPLGFVVDGPGTLSAFDTTTGVTVWTIGAQGFSTPPIVINDTLLIGDASGNLHALDPETGSALWSKNVGSPISAWTSLGAGAGKLFVSAGNELSAWVPKRN